MSSKTYTIEHQRLVPSKGYRPCEPHQACRVVIREVTVFRRNGKSYRIERNYRVFSGTAAALQARLELDRLVPKTKARQPNDQRPRKIWGRSLTIDEYNATLEGKRHG